MVNVNNLTAGYDGNDVLFDVSFSLEKGENLAIIGPNGCGKTTLLRCLAGILTYTGSITFDDKNLADLNSKQTAGKIAMLSQITNVYFDYTVFDTVMLGRYIHYSGSGMKRPSDNDYKVTENVLREVGLLSESSRLLSSLSGGQLQRVFLAKTLAQDPEIILLDEPTNHLDLSYQVKLVDFLNAWKGSDKSVIGVLHDINIAMRLSENIMLLDKGRLIKTGTAKEVIKGDIINSVYDFEIDKYMTEVLDFWK